MMARRCHRCGDEGEPVKGSALMQLHALPQLNSPARIAAPFMCANCGSEVGSNIRFVPTNKRVGRSAPVPGQPEPNGGSSNFGGAVSDEVVRLRAHAKRPIRRGKPMVVCRVCPPFAKDARRRCPIEAGPRTDRAAIFHVLTTAVARFTRALRRACTRFAPRQRCGGVTGSRQSTL